MDSQEEKRDNNNNTISLRDFIESKFKDLEIARAVQEKATEQTRLAQEKATEQSRFMLEKRLDTMNEFRNQLKDQAGTFLPRTEFDIQHSKVQEDIRILRESKATLEGKASQISVNIAIIIAVCGLIIGIIGLCLKFATL